MSHFRRRINALDHLPPINYDIDRVTKETYYKALGIRSSGYVPAGRSMTSEAVGTEENEYEYVDDLAWRFGRRSSAKQEFQQQQQQQAIPPPPFPPFNRQEPSLGARNTFGRVSMDRGRTKGEMGKFPIPADVPDVPRIPCPAHGIVPQYFELDPDGLDDCHQTQLPYNSQQRNREMALLQEYRGPITAEEKAHHTKRTQSHYSQ